jgi:hypothetical protein
MLTAIRQWVIKTMLKSKGQTGVVQTLPKKELIEINTQITAQRLLQNGIDPNSLKNSDQVENAIIAIESRPAVQQGIKSTPEAKVFDMEGKEIPKGSNIMGGKAVEADLPPPGSRGGPDDIAAPFASREETMTNMVKDELMKTDNPFSDLVKTTEKGPKTIKEREAEVLAGMEKNNKEAVQRIRNRKMVEDAIDNASPGFAGDIKYDAELVAEDLAERMGKVYDDLPTKERIKIYDEAYQGLSNQRFKNKPEPEDMAQGGRAGFKAGLGKRFLELLKGKPKPKFDVERFREGPIDLKFLENIDKKDLAPFIRSRDTMGPGGYGMYDNFADMPAGLRAAELIKTIKGPRNEINYKAAELFLGKKLRGDETVDELLQVLNRQEMRADGGRIGLKAGMTKRAFLKLMGGAGAGIAALKSGLLGIGKGAGKQVAKEVVEQGVRSTPPPYFFKLAEKIKKMGDDVTAKTATTERQQIHRYKDFELTEDVATGELTIQRIKTDTDFQYYDETLAREDYMNYKPGAGQSDEAGRVADEYIEDTGYLRTSGPNKGELYDSMDGLSDDALEEIMEEVSKEAPSIKKAGGGIARMLGE